MKRFILGVAIGAIVTEVLFFYLIGLSASWELSHALFYGALITAVVAWIIVRLWTEEKQEDER